MINIKQLPSPNFTKNRADYKIEGICIHIMAGTLKGTDSWFMNPASKASSHYGIGLNGEIHQYVKDEDQAWAQGVVSKPNFKIYKEGVNPNKYLISIECEGYDLKKDITIEQRESIIELIKFLSEKHDIKITRDSIIGHYQINSVTRLNCPSIDKSIIDDIVTQSKPKKVEDISESCKTYLEKQEKGVLIQFLSFIWGLFTKK